MIDRVAPGRAPPGSRVVKISVVLALIVLWAIFLRNAFGNDRSFALLMDNEFFIGAVLSSMSNSLAHGEWPLRMDTILGGLPLYNFPQLSPLYPFYFASLPLFRSPVEVVHSMHWITLAHLLILEINMYVFLRVIGASRIAALAAAAMFAFGANSFTYAVWLNITAPYAWFPLYLAGLVGTFKQPGRTRYLTMALIGIVFLALASPAQPLIHAVVVSVVLIIAHWASHGAVDGWRRTKYPLLLVGAIGVLALLLVAPVIVPAMLEFKNMIRWIGPFPPVIGNDRIPFAAFQVDQLPVSGLIGVLFRFEGAAVGSPFVGVVALALACVAAVSRPRHWVTNALIFVAIYSVVSSTGSNLGLAHLNYLIPILNKIREPSRFLVLFQFAIAALAALGLDELRKTVERSSDKAVRQRQLIALWVIVAIGIGAVVAGGEHIISAIPPWISLLVLVALITITVRLARWSSAYRGGIVVLVWAGAALTLLAGEVKWIPAPVSISKYNTDGGRLLDRVFDRLVALDPKREYRVLFEGTIDKQMAAMLASYKDIRTLNAYFNPAPSRQFDELYYHGPRSANYFQALGAKYLICDQCAPDVVRGYTHLESIEGIKIYEAQNVLPHSRAFTAIDGTFSSLGDFAEKIVDSDLAKGILYVQPEDAGVLVGGGPTGCASQETRRSTNRVRAAVACTSPGVLVLNEYFDPAWQASVDGEKGRVLRVNGNQMAAQLPAGSHIVEFRYRPTTFWASIPISLVGVLLLACLILFEGIWTRSRRYRASKSAFVAAPDSAV